jgi:hypothetical protein
MLNRNNNQFANKWIVYWDNAWTGPGGKGRLFSRYGDAIKFAKKQDAKPTTGHVDITWGNGSFTYWRKTPDGKKERFTFPDHGRPLYELPDWLLE